MLISVLPVTSDNCSVASIVNNALEPYATGSNIVTWTVTDGSGNKKTATQEVFVIENEKPTITAPPAVLINTNPGQCLATGVVLGIPVTWDNCDVESVVNNAPASFPVGNTLVTWTVSDAAGNTATATQNVTLIDNEPPVVNCSDIIHSSDPGVCKASITIANPAATDNCSINPTLAGVRSDGLALSADFPVGITSISWTATDDAGNISAVCVQKIIVKDDQKPIISGCPSNITQSNDAGNCSAVVTWTEPTSTDNCTASESIVWTRSHLPGFTFPIGVTAVNYTAKDAAGNTQSCSFNVTVVDNEKPIISGCPTNISKSSDPGSCTALVTWTEPTATDNCTAPGSLVWTKSHLPGSVFPLGVTTVTYTARDLAGNTSLACSFDVVISDNEKPSVTAPAIILTNTSSDGIGDCSALIAVPDAVTGDNCSVQSLTWVMTGATNTSSPAVGINQVGTQTFQTGVTLITYTLTDGSGNSVMDDMTVTVIDDEDPIINAGADISTTASSDGSADCTADVMIPNPTSVDNCSLVALSWVMTGATVGNSPLTGVHVVGTHSFNIGVTTITYTKTDASGNTGTDEMTVTVTDDVNPTITVAADISTTTSSDGTGNCTAAILIPDAIISDNCSIQSLTWNMTGATSDSSPLTGNNQVCTHTFNTGTTTIHYTIKDASGNMKTDQMTISVVDDEDPAITPAAAITTTTSSDGEGNNTANVVIPNAVINDNCSVKTLSWKLSGATTDKSSSSGINQIGAALFNQGITNILYIITDENGNIVADGLTVTVNDDENPTVTAAADIVSATSFDSAGNCTTDINVPVALTGDNCSIATLTWAMTGATTDSSPAAGINQVGVHSFNIGLTTITYTITDGSGNISTDQMTVTVTDDENPTVTASSDIVSATSFDSAGNCTTDINVPVALTGDNCSIATLTWAMTGATTDSSPAAGINQVGVHSFNIGLTTITYTITDGSGNVSTDQMTVTVTDDENPTVTASSDIVSATSFDSAGNCTTDINVPVALTGDNCSIATLTWAMTGATTDSSPAAGINQVGVHSFNIGLTTITYTITDGSGNISTDQMTVTVTDDENPTVTASSDIVSATSFDSAGNCTTDINVPVALTGDNCSIATLTWAMTGATTDSSPAAGINQVGVHSFNIGLTTITYTLTDGSGNISTDQMTVTVTDDENPTVTAPADIVSATSFDATGNCTTDINVPVALTGDNCSIATLTWAMTGATTDSSPAAGINQVGVHSFNIGLTTITYTITDGSGNVSTDQMTVTVTDDENPTVTASSDIVSATSFDSAGNCTTDINVPVALTGDNCSIATLTWAMTGATTDSSPAAGINQVGVHSFNIGLTTITYTITDGSGNISTDQMTVTVTDDENPTVTASSDIVSATSFDSAGNCTTDINVPVALTGDNCSIATLTWAMTGATTDSSPAAGINQVGVHSFNIGLTTITYTITDGSGNVSTDQMTVTVTDDENPTVTASSDIVSATSFDTSGNCTTDINVPVALTGDNCSIASLTWAMTGATTDSSPAAGINQVGVHSFNIGLTTITYTLTDGSGNVSTDQMTVTVTDDENPTVTASSDIVSATSFDSAGNCTTDINVPVALTGDNCSIATLTWAMTGATTDSSPAAGINQVGVHSFNIGLTTITYTITDGSGNVSTDQMTVTVTDDENPTVTASSDIVSATSFDTSGNCTTDINVPVALTGDNCSIASLTWAMTGATTDSSPAAGINQVGVHSFNIGLTTITYTITDGSGNISTDQMTVTVTDDENPTVTAAADIVSATSFDSAGNCTTDINVPVALTGDNCSIATLTWAMTGATTDSSPAAGINQVGVHSFNIGLTTITYTLTDGSGNVSTDQMTVTVTDDENPTVTASSDIVSATSFDTSGNCTTDINVPVALTGDNCSIASLTWAMTGATTDSSPAAGINQVGVHSFNIGLTTITYTLTDGSGNISTDQMTVTVTDDENPTVTASSDIVSATSFDSAGNCTTDINVPVALTGDNCSIATLTWAMTGATTDSSPAAGINQVGVHSFNIGLTTITYTITDGSGNVSTDQMTVTVTDDENPTVTASSDIVSATSFDSAGNCTTDINVPVALTGDNCSIATLTWAMTGATTDSSPAAGINQVGVHSFNIGLTTITYTLTDGSGNVSTDQMTVTVTDDENPTVTASSDIVSATSFDSAGNCTTDINVPVALTGDNCSIATLTWAMTGATTDSSPAAGINQVGVHSFNIGLTTITYTITDGSGNVSTDQMTVTVTDDENPTVTASSDIVSATSFDTSGNCTTDINVPVALTGDNCSIATLTWAMTGATTDSSPAAGINQVGVHSFNIGLTTITYTLTDGSGNVSTDQMTVTVTDDENPTVTASSDIVSATSFDSAGNCTTDINVPVALTGDNCSIATLTWAMTGATTDSSPAAGINQVGVHSFNIGLTTITYTITDGSGNISTDQMTVTVTDDENPTVTAAADIVSATSFDSAGNCTTDINVPVALTGDNCSIATLTWAMTGATTDSSPAAGINQVGVHSFNIGLTTITYTITDGSGNVSTDQMTVTVTDDEKPHCYSII